MMSRKKSKGSGDVLESLRKRLERRFSEKALEMEMEKRRRIRMQDTREWSMKMGNGKIPKWTTIKSSPKRASIQLARAWYMSWKTPTRVRVKTLKSGKKKYYLDIYNHTTKKMRK